MKTFPIITILCLTISLGACELVLNKKANISAEELINKLEVFTDLDAGNDQAAQVNKPMLLTVENLNRTLLQMMKELWN